jgi:hypothetical protein
VGLCLSSSCPRNAANVREFLTYGFGKPILMKSMYSGIGIMDCEQGRRGREIHLHPETGSANRHIESAQFYLRGSNTTRDH